MGILLVNKPKDMTSRDVVNIVSKELKTKKVGHTGTLDPLATGVLVLCIGDATKLGEILTSDDKEYIAEVTLGLKSDTLDITGNILKEAPAIYSKSDIKDCLNALKGTYDQEVPIYSAVKIKGKKLYEYAREGIAVDLPKRRVNIKSLELLDLKHTDNKTIFKIKCLVSKGTYIRSLVNDIAEKLNTIGVMSDLTRTKQGIFKLEETSTLEDIKNNNYHLIPIKTVLQDFYQVVCDKQLESWVLNGRVLDNLYNKSEVLFVSETGELLALYHKYNDSQIKPWKMLKRR